PVLKINPNVVEFAAIIVEKHKVAFLQFLFIFAFNNGNLFTGGAWYIDAKYFLFQRLSQRRAIYALFILAAVFVRRAPPFIYKCVQAAVLYLAFINTHQSRI